MKFCLFITGTTGAGKTLLTRYLGNHGWSTFHTGDIFRRHFGKLPPEEDPLAPKSVDPFIRSSLISLFEKNMENEFCNLVVVDGMPRKVSQVDWVEEATGWGYIPLVIVLDADLAIRKSRIRGRDISRKEVDQAKISSDEAVRIHDVMQRLNLKKIPFRYVDTSDVKVPEPCQGAGDLQIMMTIAENLLIEKWAKKGCSGPISVSHMLKRCLQELEEALMVDRIDEHVKEEVCDALWFLLLAARGLGMTGEDLFKMYRDKARVNGWREDSKTKPGLIWT